MNDVFGKFFVKVKVFLLFYLISMEIIGIFECIFWFFKLGFYRLMNLGNEKYVCFINIFRL